MKKLIFSILFLFYGCGQPLWKIVDNTDKFLGIYNNSLLEYRYYYPPRLKSINSNIQNKNRQIRRIRKSSPLNDPEYQRGYWRSEK